MQEKKKSNIRKGFNNINNNPFSYARTYARKESLVEILKARANIVLIGKLPNVDIFVTETLILSYYKSSLGCLVHGYIEGQNKKGNKKMEE